MSSQETTYPHSVAEDIRLLRSRRQVGFNPCWRPPLWSPICCPLCQAGAVGKRCEAYAQELRDDLIKLESTARLRQELQRSLRSDAPAGRSHWPGHAGAAASDNQTSDGVSPSKLSAACDAADVTIPSAAAAAAGGRAGNGNICNGAAPEQREPHTAAPTRPSETTTPQPETRRSFRPIVSVTRALARLKARSVTPPTAEDVGAAGHAQQTQAQPAAAAFASPCTTAGAAAVSPRPLKSDPGPHQRGLLPPPAPSGVQSEPAKGLCRHKRLDADVGSERAAALPERTHVSNTPAQASDTSPRLNGAFIR